MLAVPGAADEPWDTMQPFDEPTHMT